MEQGEKMRAYKAINNKKNYITNNKRNIFDSIHTQVSAKANGSNAILINICHNQKNDVNFFSKEIYQKYPIALTSREMLGKTSLGKFQHVLVHYNKEYGHKTCVANIYACSGNQSRKKRSINYYAFGRSLHQLSAYIKSNINTSESPTSKIFIHKKSFLFTGCNWVFLDSLIDDIIPDIEVEIYDQQ